MKSPSAQQKKIIYITLIISFFFFLFWFFVYAPQNRRLNLAKQQLKETEAQITEIMRITKGRKLSYAIRGLKEQFQRMAMMLPSTEQEAAIQVSEGARSQKIEIKNLAFAPKRPGKAKIAKYEIEELPISMNLACEFRVLGGYLSNLRNSSTLLTKVRELNIKSNGEGRPGLEVNLQISVYLSKASVASISSSAPLSKTIPAQVKNEPSLKAGSVLKQENHLAWERCPFSGKIYSAQKRLKDLTLAGIIWDEKKPLAIINNEIVKAQDKINGRTVIEIKHDRVILNDGSEDFELRLVH